MNKNTINYQANVHNIEKALPKELVPCQVRHYENAGIPVSLANGTIVSADDVERIYLAKTPDIKFRPLANCTHNCEARYGRNYYSRD